MYGISQFYWAREVTLSPVVVKPFTSTYEVKTCHFIFQKESSIPMTVWTVAFLVSTVYAKKSTSPSKYSKKVQ